MHYFFLNNGSFFQEIQFVICKVYETGIDDFGFLSHFAGRVVNLSGEDTSHGGRMSNIVALKINLGNPLLFCKRKIFFQVIQCVISKVL